MSYVEQVYYSNTLYNLLAIPALGNATGGTFTAGSLTGWTTGTASGSVLTFTSSTPNVGVPDLSISAVLPAHSLAPTLLENQGGAAVTETAAVTFAPLAAGQTLTLEGLTFTAGVSGATAAQMASAFSSITAGASAGSINATNNLGAAAGGIFTSGTASGWNTAAAAGAVVTFTSTTSNYSVTNLTYTEGSSNVAASLAPSIITSPGSASVNESVVATFQALTAGQTITVDGLTFTAGVSDATAAQVASAFANIAPGSLAASINTANNLGAPAGGTFTAGASSISWSSGVASGASVTFAAATLNTLSAFSIASPAIVETKGSSVSTETCAVTFADMLAGDTLTLAGLTFTAGAYGATAAQVASVFSNIATAGATAASLNSPAPGLTTAYVVVPGALTTTSQLSGNFTSPVNGQAYTFLASGTFAATTAVSTIAAIKGSITGIKFFLNGALVDSISYGASIDDTLFGVTAGATVAAQTAQAQTQFVAKLGALNSGASFIGSNASNGGNDLVQGGAGNDTFQGFSGNNYFDGKGGSNTAIFQSKAANYTVSSTTVVDRTDPLGINQVSATIVTDSVPSRDGVDTLINVQRLQFSDSALALDIGPNQTAGAIYMLYQATFNRTPDAAGLGYWIAQLDKGANIVTNVAAFFVKSQEFIAKYGANPSNSSYVDNLYQNVLHRTGEADGIAYWNSQLDRGVVTKAFVLEQFATLPEGAALVAPTISHGITYTQWVG